MEIYRSQQQSTVSSSGVIISSIKWYIQYQYHVDREELKTEDSTKFL